MLRTIQAKIVLLFFLGSLLSFALGTIGITVDRFKTEKITISTQSQQLALRLEEQLLLEEQFISYHEAELLPHIQVADKENAGQIAQLREDLTTPATAQLLTTLIKTHERRSTVFTTIVQNTADITTALQVYRDFGNSMTVALLSLSGLIDVEESNAMFQGGALPPNDTHLRNSIRELSTLVDKRTLTTQALYVVLDFDAFHHRLKLPGNRGFMSFTQVPARVLETSSVKSYTVVPDDTFGDQDAPPGGSFLNHECV